MTQSNLTRNNLAGNNLAGNGGQREREALDRHEDDGPAIAPPVDIYENSEEFLLVADLPGVPPEHVSVRLAGDRLEVDALQGVEQGKGAYFKPARFWRSFLVPDSIDPAGVNAKTQNGVLTIHLKKAEARKPKQIKVSAG